MPTPLFKLNTKWAHIIGLRVITMPPEREVNAHTEDEILDMIRDTYRHKWNGVLLADAYGFRLVRHNSGNDLYLVSNGDEEWIASLVGFATDVEVDHHVTR